MCENKNKALELIYQHLWTQEDGSETTDTWEIVDDHKRHNCDKCRTEKSLKELPKVRKICNDYRRKEKERRKRGKFQEEWYWNGQLIRTDHVSIPVEIVYSPHEGPD